MTDPQPGTCYGFWTGFSGDERSEHVEVTGPVAETIGWFPPGTERWLWRKGS